jgi:CubicO group peptidase (beta-lactamase class C family)
MRTLRALLAVVLVPAIAIAQAKPAAPPPGFDAFVASVLKQFKVPGVAVAIVKDDQVVLAKGYGVKRLGSPALVDGKTRFGIASNTKAFTAMALGLLVEEGKIEWDAPVVRYLPAFQLWDPWVTRELTVRDLLVPKRLWARSGRPALVAGLDVRPSRDCEAAPLHQAGDEVPDRVRV